MVADKMGLLKEYTQGKSVEDWIKFGFDTSGLPEAGVCTWEKFKEKRYFVVPTDPKWESYHAGMLDFYNDPAKNPLTTPSGKLEFYSERLAKHFPDDNERPPIPKWIEGGLAGLMMKELQAREPKNTLCSVCPIIPGGGSMLSVMISPGSMKFPPAKSEGLMDISTNRSGFTLQMLRTGAL